MRTCLLIFAVFVFAFTQSYAQSYKWVVDGGSTWVTTLSRDWSAVTSICTDEARNIYMTAPVTDLGIQAGTFYMAQAYICCFSLPHTLIASYDCAGNFRWAKLIDASQLCANNGLVYNNGYLYVSETMVGDSLHIGNDTTLAAPATANCVSAVIKLDTLGNFKWLRSTGVEIVGGCAVNREVVNIAIDGHGNIHHYDFVPNGTAITSSITSVMGTYDLKYSPAGNLLSVLRMQLDTLGGMYSAQSDLLDYPVINKASGVVYATVYVTDTTGGFGAQVNCLAAYDTLGHVIWYDTCHWPNSFTGLAYDGNNHLYTIGAAQFDTGNFKAHFPLHGDTLLGNHYAITCLSSILTLDTFGNLKHHYDVDFSENGGFQHLAIVPGGKLATIGIMVYAAKYGTDSLVNTTGKQEPFNAVFDTAGHLLHWDYDTGTAFYNWGTAVASDNIGDVYFAGLNSGQLTIPGMAPFSIAGASTSFYVAKYGVSCTCTTLPVASFTYTGTTTLSFTYTGTTGYDSLKWTFGDGNTSTAANPTHTYSTTGAYTVCVTVYTACGSSIYCYTINGTTNVNSMSLVPVEIYPNPATTSLTIKWDNTIKQVRISNLIGQTVYSHEFSSQQVQANVSGLPAGVYFVKVNGCVVRKFMKE